LAARAVRGGDGKNQQGLQGDLLEGFEADLAILFGARLTDPDDAAADGVQFIIAGDDLDELPGPQPEATAEAETFGGAVHDEAGNPLGVRAEVDDHTRSLFHGDTFATAAFAPKEGWHGFFPDGEFPHYTDYAMSAIRGRHRVNTRSVRGD
jgi:hypothetical protein